MARLRSHGRELMRVELERDVDATDRSITWERITRTYHEDGHILQKYDVRFKPDAYHPAGELYNYGWKLYAKVKKGVDPAAHAAKAAEVIRSNGTETKWKIVSAGAGPVVISIEDVMEAVQSGEFVGICKECGHEHDGCEPDARNYKCENCGAMAVYGAEELLIA